jgi:tetratricopeptide (TPR) repeat protein
VTELQPTKEEEAAASWVAYSDFLLSRDKVDEATQAIEKALELIEKALALVEKARGVDKEKARLQSDRLAVIARAVTLYSLSTEDSVRKKGSDLLVWALAQDPNDPALLEVQARRLLASGTASALSDARQALDRITQQRPRQVSAWIMTVRCALKQGLPDAALDAVSKGLAVDPTDAQRRELLLLKAEAEKLRGPALAVTTLRGLWEENKKDMAVGLALAQTYRETGEPRKAIAVLQEMRGEDRASLDVGLPLAETYRDAGEVGQAISVLEEMKGLVSGRELAAVNLALADTLDLAGRTDEGLQLARSTAEASPEEPRAIPALVQILVRHARWDEVYSELASWQKKHPADIGSLLASTQVLLAAGQAPGDTTSAAQAPQMARKVLQELVVDPPRDVAAKQALASVYQAAGLAEAAEKVYREVLQELSDNAPDKARVLNNLAWLLCGDKNRYEEALTLVSKAIESSPQFANAVDTRGVIYHRMGRLKEARADLEACISQSFEGSLLRSEAEFHLAQVLKDQGEGARAAVLLERCLARPRARGGLPEAERQQAQTLRSELSSSARQGTR